MRPSGSAPSRLADRLRLPHLDAVRGIAALAVVIHHTVLSLPSGGTVVGAFAAVPGVRIVALGRPAVVLFFVMSGFVLTLALRGARPGIGRFALRRAVRLLPPYWVAIIIAAAAYMLVPRHHAAAMSPWFNAQWGSAVSPGDIVRHLVMVAGPNQFPLDHVAWSLVHELRLSILLPLLVLFAARFGSVAALAAAVAVSLGAEAVVSIHPGGFDRGAHGYLFDTDGVASLVLTARYCVAFTVGMVLALEHERIGAFQAARPRLRFATIAAGVACLSMLQECVMVGGAAMLIASVASARRLATALDVAPINWLGRVSYSLYLVHLPIMLAVGLSLDGVLSAPASLALATALALLAAELMYRLVERPSIRWSRALALRPRPSQPATAPLVTADA